MMDNRLFLIIISGLLFSAGCQTITPRLACNNNDIDLNSFDYTYQIIKMTDAMMLSPEIRAITTNKRAVIFVANINNESSMDIDIELIKKTIEQRLNRSGKFILTNAADAEYILKGTISNYLHSVNEGHDSCKQSALQYNATLNATASDRIIWSTRQGI